LNEISTLDPSAFGTSPERGGCLLQRCYAFTQYSEANA
jgi:hypothetical protein